MGNSLTAIGISEVIEGLVCCTTSTLTALFSSCSTRYPRFLFSLFLVFGTVLSFLSITPNMRSKLDQLPYFCTAITTGQICDSLLGYGAVYRICLSLAAFYGGFALLMLNTTSAKDCRLKFHNGFWFLKLVLLLAILAGAFHIPRHTEFGRLMMYVGLTAGFIFIMIQILVVIDFAHSWSVSWQEKTDSRHKHCWNFALIFSIILLYAMAITMALFCYLYFIQWQDLSKCQGNMFVISFNVLHCLIASVISLLPQVQDTTEGSGLLQSSIVSLYTMYLTWCALSSEPDGSCNPMGDVILEYDKVSGLNGQAVFDCVLMLVLLIFACNVRANTSRLEKIGFSLSKYSTRDDDGFNYQDVEKYSDDKENLELEYNYSLFHFVMFLASLQLMMVVTNWHGPDELAEMKKLVKNWATVWIQLTSSFLCVLIYIWVTVTPLFLKTWGPCLGLDYESVPTEDDDERLRRRREISRERRAFKCNKIENNFKKERKKFDMTDNFGELRKNSVKKCLENANLSKDLGIEHDFNISERASGSKLQNFPSSLARAQKHRVEQITDDSGLCDTTNFTTQSRTISRENLHLTQSSNNHELTLEATGQRREERALSREHNLTSYYALSCATTRNEKQRRPWVSEKENITAQYNTYDNYGTNVSMPRRIENLNRTSKPSNANGKIDQLHLNKHTMFERGQEINLRPHSSLAFSNNKTLTENTKIPMHNSSATVPKRPYSSMAFTGKTFSDKNDLNNYRSTTSNGLEEKSGHSSLALNCIQKLTEDGKTIMLHDSPAKTTRAFKECKINELSMATKDLPKRPHSSIDFTNSTFAGESTNSTQNRRKTLINRPHSSITVANKTISKEGKENIPKDKKVLTTRPASCPPSLTIKKTTLLQKNNDCRSLLREEDSSRGSNSAIKPTVGLQTDIKQTDFADKYCESLDGSGFKSKQIESEGHVFQTGSKETLFEMGEEMRRGREKINKGGLNLNIQKTIKDTTSEKSTVTQLRMKDHLKWVKSLRQIRESVVFLKKPRTTSENSMLSENRNVGADLFVESKKDKKQGLSSNVLLDTKTKQETLKGDENREIIHVNMSSNSESNDIACKKLSQDASTRDEKTQGKERESNREDLQRAGNDCSTPQTCEAAQEILRLQEKILKFQAKVVKTQKKILDMQQQGKL